MSWPERRFGASTVVQTDILELASVWIDTKTIPSSQQGFDQLTGTVVADQPRFRGCRVVRDPASFKSGSHCSRRIYV